MDIDKNVRKCAIELQNTKLLSKLASGDMVAIDAEYHLTCLTKLYRRYMKHHSMSDDKVNSLHGIAFARVISYIESSHDDSSVAPIFILADLGKMYSTYLENLGVKVDGRLHTTRLKKRILAYFPDMISCNQGNNVTLAFDKDIGLALRKMHECDYDSEAMHLARAANIIRSELFKCCNIFNGTFTQKHEDECISSSLLELVNMILHGPAMKSKNENTSNMSAPFAAHTIADLIAFNSLQHKPRDDKVNPGVHRHNKNRETPTPIYLGLKVHVETRKRDLVDKLHNMGLSISYKKTDGHIL